VPSIAVRGLRETHDEGCLGDSLGVDAGRALETRYQVIAK
jgi:hypothetical protein